jgi:predicted nucleotidyltransferase
LHSIPDNPPDWTGDPDPAAFLSPYGTLFRKSALALLVFLGRGYTQRFHVRDLARSLGYDVSIVSRNLKAIEGMGLVTREDVGNLAFYRANMESALLRHMKVCFSLLELNDLVRALAPIASNIVLYGSCATGEDTVESDIDLFIETADRASAAERVDAFARTARRPVSAIVATPADLYAMKTSDPALYASIRRGITLKEAGDVAPV